MTSTEISSDIDTSRYDPDAAPDAPTVVSVRTIPEGWNHQEQTEVMWSDGTRVTVAADGRVKAGRDWTRIERSDIDRRNYNPDRDWPRKGSPASGFVNLYFTPRDDAPQDTR